MRNELSEIESMAAVTIRRIDEQSPEREALRQLSERDSQPLPAGPVLAAEVEGALLAAISLTDGRVIADPFARTAELRSLLELRAAQLRRRRRHAERRLKIRPRRRARAALPSSPPGAGGRLIELPR